MNDEATSPEVPPADPTQEDSHSHVLDRSPMPHLAAIITQTREMLAMATTVYSEGLIINSALENELPEMMMDVYDIVERAFVWATVQTNGLVRAMEAEGMTLEKALTPEV